MQWLKKGIVQTHGNRYSCTQRNFQNHKSFIIKKEFIHYVYTYTHIHA